MADYSTSIRTQYVEPRIYQPNKQVEFRFNKNTLYSSNLKITNFGLTASVDRDYNSNIIRYNNAVGVLGLIRHIRLMDGSRELTSQRHAYNYLAFKNINANNEQVTDLHDMNHKSSASWLYTHRGICVPPNESQNIDIRVNPLPHNFSVIKTLADTTDADLGTIDLRLVLPLLNVLPALDTKIFPNLRLVIEYEDDARKLVDNVGEKALGGAITFTTTRPLIIADEVIGDSKSAMLRSASTGSFLWNEIQNDMFQIPDMTATANAGGDDDLHPQEVSAIVNGFDNKYLSRVLICKNATDLSTLHFPGNQEKLIYGRGYASSFSGFKESLQVRSSGANLFTGDGIANTGWQQMLLSETWGVVTIAPFGGVGGVGSNTIGEPTNLHNVNGAPIPLSFNTSDAATDLSPVVGQYSYYGFSVEDMVKQLQFTYNRTAVKDTTPGPKYTSQAMDINVYGEVRKQLVLGKGGYEVKYM